VDYVPELKLGGLKWPHNRLRQKLGLRRADLVISDSNFLATRIRRLATPRRLETVYMGVDVDRFAPGGAKERLVLSVCFSITRETSVLKGLPTLVDAAVLVPDAEFVIVGRSGGDGALEELARRAPANVSFTRRFVGDDELLDLYRRASVYAQVSAHEAFGVAVAEAMACGCIPVAARGSALQEVAGPVARDVDYGDAAATAAAIGEALAASESDRAAARARVVERYPIGRRIERLAELLSPLVG